MQAGLGEVAWLPWLPCMVTAVGMTNKRFFRERFFRNIKAFFISFTFIRHPFPMSSLEHCAYSPTNNKPINTWNSFNVFEPCDHPGIQPSCGKEHKGLMWKITLVISSPFEVFGKAFIKYHDKWKYYEKGCCNLFTRSVIKMLLTILHIGSFWLM